MIKRTIIAALVLIFVSSMGIYAYDLEGLSPITMTIAHPENPEPTNFIQAAALAFQDYVETASEGKVKVSISPGGQLGDSAELPQQVQMGVVEAAMSISEGHIAPYFKESQVIAIPYLFRSVDHALYTLGFDTEFGRDLWGRLEEQTGLKVLAIWDNGGFRNFTNNKRPIHGPEDLKGLKIRTMQIPAHMEMVKALGANPVPVAWTELYNALQLNVADGQENSIPTIDLGNLHEVQKYLTIDRHVFSMHIFPVNAQWFEGLPEAYQDIIRVGAMRASDTARRQTRIQRDTLQNTFREAGMEIYTPTPEEQQAFREAAQEPVLKFIREQVGDELVDGLLEAADEAAVALGYEN